MNVSLRLIGKVLLPQRGTLPNFRQRANAPAIFVADRGSGLPINGLKTAEQFNKTASVAAAENCAHFALRARGRKRARPHSFRNLWLRVNGSDACGFGLLAVILLFNDTADVNYWLRF